MNWKEITENIEGHYFFRYTNLIELEARKKLNVSDKFSVEPSKIFSGNFIDTGSLVKGALVKVHVCSDGGKIITICNNVSYGEQYVPKEYKLEILIEE